MLKKACEEINGQLEYICKSTGASLVSLHPFTRKLRLLVPSATDFAAIDAPAALAGRQGLYNYELVKYVGEVAFVRLVQVQPANAGEQPL